MRASRKCENDLVWKPCSLLLTVDRNVLVVDGVDSYFSVPAQQHRARDLLCKVDHHQLVLVHKSLQYFCFGPRRASEYRVDNPDLLHDFQQLLS